MPRELIVPFSASATEHVDFNLKERAGSCISTRRNFTRESAVPVVSLGAELQLFEYVDKREEPPVRPPPGKHHGEKQKKRLQKPTTGEKQRNKQKKKMVAKQRIRMANEKHSKNITQRGNVAKSTVSPTAAHGSVEKP